MEVVQNTDMSVSECGHVSIKLYLQTRCGLASHQLEMWRGRPSGIQQPRWEIRRGSKLGCRGRCPGTEGYEALQSCLLPTREGQRGTEE
jgi:hypothetical protein